MMRICPSCNRPLQGMFLYGLPGRVCLYERVATQRVLISGPAGWLAYRLRSRKFIVYELGEYWHLLWAWATGSLGRVP